MSTLRDFWQDFWRDWFREWVLYGAVYAINMPEPHVIPAGSLTVHEGPCALPTTEQSAVIAAAEAFAGWMESPRLRSELEEDLAEAVAALRREQP